MAFTHRTSRLERNCTRVHGMENSMRVIASVRLMPSNRGAYANFSSPGEISATSRTSLSLCLLPDLLNPSFAEVRGHREIREYNPCKDMPPATRDEAIPESLTVVSGLGC